MTRRSCVSFRCQELSHRPPQTQSRGRTPPVGASVRFRALLRARLARESSFPARSSLTHKSPIVFNDTELNTPRVVYVNIFQNLCHCAMKTTWHIVALDYNPDANADFFLGTFAPHSSRPRPDDRLRRQLSWRRRPRSRTTLSRQGRVWAWASPRKRKSTYDRTSSLGELPFLCDAFVRRLMRLPLIQARLLRVPPRPPSQAHAFPLRHHLATEQGGEASTSFSSRAESRSDRVDRLGWNASRRLLKEVLYQVCRIIACFSVPF